MPDKDVIAQHILDKLVATAKSESSFDPNDPRVQILLLAARVDNIGREKEELEKELQEERIARNELAKRVAKMENSFQKGAGILMVLPIVGTLVGLLFAYGKIIFAPWTGSK